MKGNPRQQRVAVGRVLLAVVVVCGLFGLAGAVDRSRFKKCEQSGFCRRNRDRFTPADPAPRHLGAFAVGELAVRDGAAATVLRETVPAAFVAAPDSAWPARTLEAVVRAYEGGVFRVTVNETRRADGLAPRYSPEDVVVDRGLRAVPVAVRRDAQTGRQLVTVAGGAASGAAGTHATLVLPAPGDAFAFELRVGGGAAGAEHTAVAARNMVFENHVRKPVAPPPPVAEGPMPQGAAADAHPAPTMATDADAAATDAGAAAAAAQADKAEKEKKATTTTTTTTGPRLVEIDGAWDETFGGRTDSKPNGPGAVGLDMVFAGADAVYGLPEHTTTLALRDTRAEHREPYRLFNADVFEYETDETMALYGAVPLVLAHDSARGTTAGVLWLNPTETWVDVQHHHRNNKAAAEGQQQQEQQNEEEVRWTSEDGLVDVWLFAGPEAEDVFRQSTAVTGRPFLPPLFATAYHQSRWNYNSQDDVRDVDAGFDAHDIPYDVLWLDIEHTDGKRYFTWDQSKFAEPEAMQRNLSAKGRRLVTIVDPHIKRDSGYYVHSEAAANGYYVKRADGHSDYEGHCWPGTSHWVDFFNPAAREWWAAKFGLDQYRGSSERLFIWTDMNEPAIFNGPETTMDRDARHAGGLEHRQVHNAFGHVEAMATYEGVRRRVDNQRPFVLSRSFFAGTQRYAAIWTGDNRASWAHLQAMFPMVLSLNLAGIVFSGADVGGFFGNPEPELLVRWYQAAAFVPFFRAHAHLDTARREPWLFGENNTALIRAAVARRYALLPYLYTLFRDAATTGAPVARALWTVFPRDAATATVDNALMLGPALLVQPVTRAGAASERVYLPAGVWYDHDTLAPVAGPRTLDVPTPLSKVPAFYRGGHVVPLRTRPRRSSTQQARDPYTLVVAPDAAGEAAGALYIDDGISFDYARTGAFDLVRFRLAPQQQKQGGSTLTATVEARAYATPVGIERIVVLGAAAAPHSVTIAVAGSAPVPVEFVHNAEAQTLTLKKPVPSVLSDWTITIA